MTARRFKPSEVVDFVVVGSGAAGDVMARELSQSGFTVVVLEQGPRFTSADFEHDEFKYSFLNGITNSPEINPQTFRDDPSHTALRPRMGNSVVYARMVGGSSNHFTANYWRFHEIDCHERSVLGIIAGIGFAGAQRVWRTEPRRTTSVSSPSVTRSDEIRVEIEKGLFESCIGKELGDT